jgi:hypothetical protein
MTTQQEHYERQPIFFINNVAYVDMHRKLTNGSAGEWSYPFCCTHKKVLDCNCPRFLNVLKDGKIMRLIKGEWKETLPESESRYFIVRKVEDTMVLIDIRKQ